MRTATDAMCLFGVLSGFGGGLLQTSTVESVIVCSCPGMIITLSSMGSNSS